MFKILVVEDDDALRDLFSTFLSDNGYEIYVATDGEEALSILEEVYVNLLITDIMMPHMDGFELTKGLRDMGYDFPVLMITAKHLIADKKTGFKAGTDDYMVKPVDLNEMLWRVEALLRRSQMYTEKVLTFRNTRLNYDSMTVNQGDGEIVIPQKEFYLLFKFLSSPDRVFTKRQLMDEIWGFDVESDPHTVEVHISRLRTRFKDSPDFDIITVRGLGYKAVEK